VSDNQAACVSQPEAILFPTEKLSFEQIPHQSRIFLDYLKKPQELRKYYPNALNSHTELSRRVPEVLENYTIDRNRLCDALLAMNQGCNTTEATLKSIEKLREPDCVAVVSGQQAGLFTGSLYTIYKALSAVKVAACLNGRGIKAVPVFWIATEDHDFAEVATTHIIGQNGHSVALKNDPSNRLEGIPVGSVELDETISQTIAELFDALPNTEFSAELRELIEDSWHAGAYYGDAFAKMLTALLGQYGLIMLCPLSPAIKQLAAPLYVKAIEKSGEIVSALQARSRDLVENGYHAQVFIPDDYFPLFWQATDKTRHALKRTAEGRFKAKDFDREFTLEELADLARREPTRFSPNVVLRSVVQDYLLPTVCYFGGSAEVAYFAQSGETYRVLERPVTTIFARSSLTIVEPRERRTMETYNLQLTDLFEDQQVLLARFVEEFLNSETARVFAETEETVNTSLHRLEQSLINAEPTLAESTARRRQKILYHVATLRRKYHQAELKKHEIARKRIEDLYAALYPKHGLQERSLNIASFYARHGKYAIDWIYNAVDPDEKRHQILFL
jgi:bacillithiol biosynthesis cysteine-adding enzyme BshC